MSDKLRRLLFPLVSVAGISLVLPGSPCPGRDEAPPPAAEHSAPATALEIDVRPRKVFCSAFVTLALRELPTDGDRSRIRWRATGGLLLYDDLPEVHWRAPSDPGSHMLSVTVLSGDGIARSEVSVDVHAPVTDGMVRIPSGTFLRGDVDGTRNLMEVKTVQNANDEPFHLVHVDGYWIDRYPVTNRSFVRFLEAALEQGMARVEKIAVMGEFEGSWVPYYYLERYEQLIRGYYETRNARRPEFLHAISWDGERFRIAEGQETHPVVDVTWFGAASYANFIGRRLPTEAQWEKAARGTDGRRYPWGDHLPTPYHVNLRGELTPVGTYSPLGDSPYGVGDMVSPCHEWSGDWFNPDYYRDYRGETPHRNPEGPFWGSSHSIRGSPLALYYLTPSVIRSAPLSRRYNWRFEFLLGDSFADRQTTFRTVVPSASRSPGSADVDLLKEATEGTGEELRDDGGPRGRSPSEDFNAAETCRECHPRQYLEWRGSTHAYALVDPAFLACHRKALKETGGEIGTGCLECHSPIGVRSGELTPVFRQRALSAQIREGVTCEVCHRMEPEHAVPGRANANFALSPGDVLFGRLYEPEENPFHDSARSDFLGQSEFCGTCHEVVHDARTIEKTFTEWSDSVLADPRRSVSCQECHMLRYSGRAAIDGPFREELRRHNFPGVSLPLAPFPNRGYQQEEIRRFLRTATRMWVVTPEAAEAGGVLNLRVSVKNSGTGHNLPAGSMRQMWLEVTALDAQGHTVYRSGHLDANGDLMNEHSELEPGGDPDLVTFSDAHLNDRGEEVPYWRATRLREGSLRHLETRRATYGIPVPAALEGTSLEIRVRLLIRALAPRTLRGSGLEEMARKVPVWEMSSFESGPLPVVREVPRRTEYRVPGDFAGIQEAVDALRDGDSLEVAPGEYTIDRELDFRGRRIRVFSREGPDRTVLRLNPDLPDEDRGSVVVFRSGEGPGARLEGFTITGGRGTLVDGTRRGGGVYVHRSSPTLIGNRILSNTAAGGSGGGIYCEEGNPRIAETEVLACRADLGGGLALRLDSGHAIVLERDSIQGNVARLGGGLYVDTGRRVRIVRSVVAGNQAHKEGAGVFAANGVEVEIDHATFVHNRAVLRCGAVRAGCDEDLSVSNSIFWSNRPFHPGRQFRYSLLDRETPGSPTNTVAFPLFVDPSAPWFDDRLSAVRWARPRDTDWVPRWGLGDYQLLAGSPAIDAGDPRAPADPDDTRSDIGALYLEQMLKGFVRGDVDGSGSVDSGDLVALVRHLLITRTEISCVDTADVDDGGTVDLLDAVLLAGFLCCGVPGQIAPPFPDCGVDATFGEGLTCQQEPGYCGGSSALPAATKRSR